MYMAPVLSSWHTSVDIMVAMANPSNRPGDTNVRGLLILALRGSSSLNDWVISLKPGGGIFSWAPEASRPGSSFTWHTGSGEL